MIHTKFLMKQLKKVHMIDISSSFEINKLSLKESLRWTEGVDLSESQLLIDLIKTKLSLYQAERHATLRGTV